jgi:hypothetical protein
VIDTTYPLHQVDAAISHVEAGRTRGKVALHVRATGNSALTNLPSACASSDG